MQIVVVIAVLSITALMRTACQLSGQIVRQARAINGYTQAPMARGAGQAGGAGGLGKALAHRLLKEDWRVVLMDLPGALQALKLESERVERVACDLTDEAAVASVCAGISTRHPALDLVIHNAGVTQIGLFDETTLASQRLVMEINYFGSVRMAAMPDARWSAVARDASRLSRSARCRSTLSGWKS